MLWEPLPWSGQMGESRKPSLDGLKIQAVCWLAAPSLKIPQTTFLHVPIWNVSRGLIQGATFWLCQFSSLAFMG